MTYKKKTDMELLKLYIDYVGLKEGLAPNAPAEAKAAYEEATRRGQKKLNLWKKGIRLD